MTLNTPNITPLATAVTQFTNGTINGAGNLSIGGNATWTSVEDDCSEARGR